jgi:Arc/MetJ-type ribon-helix-helix transcriptional regulator
VQIQLSDNAAEIVKTQVASGIYADATAFVSDVLLKYDSFYKKKLDTLKREIAIGLEQANRGEVAEFDFDQFMQEMDEELGYTNAKP